MSISLSSQKGKGRAREGVAACPNNRSGCRLAAGLVTPIPLCHSLKEIQISERKNAFLVIRELLITMNLTARQPLSDKISWEKSSDLQLCFLFISSIYVNNVKSPLPLILLLSKIQYLSRWKYFPWWWWCSTKTTDYKLAYYGSWISIISKRQCFTMIVMAD